ncbi:hypothetical protein KYC5002_30810 [Archangium violaceum]|uniref:hypothetical protein n=1 Tax=Archangium violaceum TaxID=83451 RepID=UPI002B2A36E8|nr:hypothetical protein KYC5002_30810 [Archangium gephyra]
MNYFVITESKGTVPPPAFTRQLKSRWPGATVEEVPNPASSHALEFSVPMEHSRVDGSLNREGCSIVFIGDIRDCADFALWCRTLLPPGEPATFCDESMSGSLQLDTTTTLADIFRAFDYQPPPP